MSRATSRRPESVLVVVHDGRGRVLLMRRVDLGFWQSVTGSLQWDENDPREAACRELAEETGIRARPADLEDWRVEHRFAIAPALAWRFAPGVTHNTEHLYSLMLDHTGQVRLNPSEHDEFGWFEASAALEKAWSWSNRLGIRRVLAVP